MAEPLQFFINAKGRFVSGDMDKLRTKDHQGKPLEFAKQSYDYGIAYNKQEVWSFLAEQVYPYLAGVWAADPQNLQRLAAWFQQPGLKGALGGLSMKIADGDAPKSDGTRNEHTAGCFVFYGTSFGSGEKAEPPKIYAGPNAQALVQIDLSQIKRGDYCTFAGSIVPNGQAGNNAGIYLNAGMIWKLEDGPAIAGGVDPNTAFGGATLSGAYDPSAGASSAFGAPGNPAGGAAPGQAPQYAPAALPGTPQSATGYAPGAVPGAGAPGGFAPTAPGAAPAGANAGFTQPGLPGSVPSATGFPGNVQPHTEILYPHGGPVPGAVPTLPGA